VFDAKIDAKTVTVALPVVVGNNTGNNTVGLPVLSRIDCQYLGFPVLRRLVVLYCPYCETAGTTQYGGVTATTLWKTTTVLKILAKISSELMNHELIPKIPLRLYC
jgi:hypothetical protein